jgi:hypothetical protein
LVTAVSDHAVESLIETIVAGAHIPSRKRRDELRRELLAHFEDAGTTPEAVRDALRRFGSEALITESLRRVYQWDYAFLYLTKIAASIVVSAAVALLIEVVVNLRVEAEAEAWRLAPGFSHGVALAIAVVLALVTAWEATRPPLQVSRALIALSAYATVCGCASLLLVNATGAFASATILAALSYACARTTTRTMKIMSTFIAFAAAEYVLHRGLPVAFGPARVLMASVVLLAIWACTVSVATRMDRVFRHSFEAV